MNNTRHQKTVQVTKLDPDGKPISHSVIVVSADNLTFEIWRDPDDCGHVDLPPGCVTAEWGARGPYDPTARTPGW